MSVLVINRDLSELEYYHQANDLYKDMTQLLLRNFGIKTKKKGLVISNTEKSCGYRGFSLYGRSIFKNGPARSCHNLTGSTPAG